VSPDIRIRFPQKLIWVKARGFLTHSHYVWGHEPCFYGWVEGAPCSARTSALVADLIEPAKATALENLGEGERAFGIATGWLRTRMEPLGSPPGADPAGSQTPTL